MSSKWYEKEQVFYFSKSLWPQEYKEEDMEDEEEIGECQKIEAKIMG